MELNNKKLLGTVIAFEFAKFIVMVQASPLHTSCSVAMVQSQCVTYAIEMA